MTIKQKLWNIGKYLIPIKVVTEAKTMRGYHAGIIYSVTLGIVSSFYITAAIKTKTLNPKEQWRIIKQRQKIYNKESDLREKLFDFIDKNNDGRHTIDELMNFSKKTGVSCDRFSMSYSLNSLKLKELEKAVQSYEAESRGK